MLNLNRLSTNINKLNLCNFSSIKNVDCGPMV